MKRLLDLLKNTKEVSDYKITEIKNTGTPNQERSLDKSLVKHRPPSVVKTLHFQCRKREFDPWSGN